MGRVRLVGVSRNFGKVQAVRDLHLDIADGELVCLLGPSGCGKTTTLRMVAGLEPVDRGEIWIGERDVTHLEPRDRHVGMMFQSLALYPHMRVFDNMAYPLKVRHVPLEERRRRVTQVAELLGLTPLLDRYPAQLSGGQQQRVALGRAMVQEPQVFLLDEPFSSLDAKLRAVMRSEIRRIQTRIGTTMILVTHDQLDALTVADRIAVMRDGVLQQYGSPRDIYYNPANAFVARFVGEPTINLLPGEAAEDGGRRGIRVLGCWLSLDGPEGEEAWHSLERSGERRVLVGIRPTDIQMLPSSDPGWARGRVQLVEPGGSEVVYEVAVGEQVLRVKLPDSERTAFRSGDEVTLSPDGGRLHLFSEDGERRLSPPVRPGAGALSAR